MAIMEAAILKYLHSPTTSLDEPVFDRQGSYIDEGQSFTLHYVFTNNVTAKWNSWLANVTVDWLHVLDRDSCWM